MDPNEFYQNTALDYDSSYGDLDEQAQAKKRRIALVVIIVLLLLSSLILLAFRLVKYAQEDDREVALEDGKDTDVHIFSVHYQGADGETVIHSNNGDKVVAPGAQSSYVIRLRNADEYAIDYALEPKVVFSTRHQIPLQVRMYDAQGKYLLGSESEWATLQDLRTLTHTGTLEKAEAAEFVFEWMWPYESGNDEHDTMLGNQDKDIGLEVSFAFHSVANTTLEDNGGWDGHPDHGKNIVLAFIALALLIGLIILIVYIIKKRKEALANAKDELPEVEQTPAYEPARAVPYVAQVDLAVLDANFSGGAVINLVLLKQMGIVPISASGMHVVASSGYRLTKTFVVMTQSISPEARKSIIAAGGVVLITPN